MRNMKDMPYVIGLKIRLYPDNEQKVIIAVNDGASRSIYNHLVARHQELFILRKTKCYVKPVMERIDYLTSLGEKSSDLQSAYPYLQDKRIDAQTIANAVKNYHTAWNHFIKVSGTSIPKFHKKGYTKQYQTNAHYKKDSTLISDGNVYLNGAKAWKKEKHNLVKEDAGVEVRLQEEDGQYKLITNLYDYLKDFSTGIITSDILGKAFEPEQRFEERDGSDIVFQNDYLGNHRGVSTIPGPFANAGELNAIL